jgi:hypothetical protein
MLTTAKIPIPSQIHEPPSHVLSDLQHIVQIPPRKNIGNPFYFTGEFSAWPLPSSTLSALAPQKQQEKVAGAATAPRFLSLSQWKSNFAAPISTQFATPILAICLPSPDVPPRLLRIDRNSSLPRRWCCPLKSLLNSRPPAQKKDIMRVW